MLKPMRLQHKVGLVLPSIFWRKVHKFLHFMFPLWKMKYVCTYMRRRHVKHEGGGISNNEEQYFQFVKTC